MYTIREAADRAGMTSELLRAWERRYGIVTPRRTPAGYRLYDEPAIARVRAMRSLVDEGWTPSAAAAAVKDLPDGELPHAAPPRDVTAEDTTTELIQRFVRAAADMDTVGVQSFLDEVSARGSFEAVMNRYLFPALHALGDAWERGDVSVAAEHAASAAVQRWLSAAYEAASASRGATQPVLVGLPPGARHELGALAFATAARRSGVTVHYVGADLPATDWVAAARATDAAAAVIGVPTAADATAARRVASALRRADGDLQVFFGGAGSDGMPRAFVLAHGPAEAASALRSRLRLTRPDR
jgi:DNA-binding transcriptional MerR regulator/methylmalonyl-CoA mutase cobalamin-binding subunit